MHWAYGPEAEKIKARLSEVASNRVGELSPRYGKTKETNPLFSNGGCPKGTTPWNKGLSAKKYLSKKALANISAGRKGKPAWNSGVKGCHSPETIAKMIHEGSDNAWYIDGRHSENCPYPKDWTRALKKSIRRRDGYRCQICMNRKGRKETLSVHHIDYDKENCDPKNLITLCRKCHTKTNTNRSKWISFFARRQRSLNIREGAETIPQGSRVQANGTRSARRLHRRERMI
jgi:hypothetical protein